MKHYGNFLFFATRSVKNFSDDIEIFNLQKQTLLKQLKNLEERIKEEENNFLKFIESEWTTEEIQEAKERCDAYNGKFKTNILLKETETVTLQDVMKVLKYLNYEYGLSVTFFIDGRFEFEHSSFGVLLTKWDLDKQYLSNQPDDLIKAIREVIKSLAKN